jgi:Flp pilus assembly protein TadG
MPRPRSPLRAARDGNTAIEFGIIAPVMALFLIGVFDISKVLILSAELNNASHLIPVSATTISVQPNNTTVLTGAQAQQAMSLIYAEIPWLRDGIEAHTASVTLSSVAFVPVTTGCTQTTGQNCYTAAVMWSVAYGDLARTAGTSPFATAILRPCTASLVQIQPTQAIPVGQTRLTILRTANVTQPDPILVADVHYQYVPFFTKFITGPLDMWSSGYWSVRSVSALSGTVSYTTLAPGSTTAAYCVNATSS